LKGARATEGLLAINARALIDLFPRSEEEPEEETEELVEIERSYRFGPQR